MILYELRHFFRLCHICGIFPFLFNFDKSTRQYRSVTFSMKHFVFWWFLMIALFQIASPLVSVLLVSLLIAKDSFGTRHAKTPAPVIVFTALTVGFLYVLLFLFRYSALRLKKLKQVFFCFKEIETFLSRYQTIDCSSVRSRFTGGAVSVLLFVSYSILTPNKLTIESKFHVGFYGSCGERSKYSRNCRLGWNCYGLLHHDHILSASFDY